MFEMPPERLSTDLTSLNPDEDRIAVVISFVVDREEAVGGEAVGRSVVRNHARLAYNSVAAWLDGPDHAAPAEGGDRGQAVAVHH
jgi:exoribonuclease-2